MELSRIENLCVCCSVFPKMRFVSMLLDKTADFENKKNLHRIKI